LKQKAELDAVYRLILLMSSNYQINDFMRQIGTFKSGRARLAIDYEKLLKTKFSYFLIITERETRVKTYGAKQLLYSK